MLSILVIIMKDFLLHGVKIAPKLLICSTFKRLNNYITYLADIRIEFQQDIWIPKFVSRFSTIVTINCIVQI